PAAPPEVRAAAAAGERRWTVLELLRWTTAHFAEKGIESARLDAELLLAHALGTTRMQLYVDFEKPVLADERGAFRELVRKRAAERIPVSQLLGAKEFWSLSLAVNGDVLTPRPDTETLVQAALDRLPERERAFRIADIGTGSGAIALALAAERPNAHVVATDISEAALKVARSNAESLRLNERVRLAQGSLFEPLAGPGAEPFDLVVSNPPYLARAEAATLPPELRHEPAEALFGGEDGLEVLRPLVAGATGVMAAGGHLLVEIDPRQADAVVAMCEDAGLCEIAVIRDLAGSARVVAGRAAPPR
ncbi:MAG: peptide chain release factor N(5)-glutamine methyltransferase, partial [Myxococcales bacterium]|nr:peptide chain release factor N(5)-glutamine methyltransferase [Myxococcales bacterium]